MQTGRQRSVAAGQASAAARASGFVLVAVVALVDALFADRSACRCNGAAAKQVRRWAGRPFQNVDFWFIARFASAIVRFTSNRSHSFSSGCSIRNFKRERLMASALSGSNPSASLLTK